jgi:hypothetical protein
LDPAPSTLVVSVREKGKTYVAHLTARWQNKRGAYARRLLEQAQRRMRALRSVREREVVSSVPGVFARTDYRLKAPDRLFYRTSMGAQSVIIAKAQWTRPEPRFPWRKGSFGGGGRFSTRSWFTWTTYAQYVYLLGFEREGARRLAVVGLMDPGSPAWWRLYVDLRTRRVVHDRLITGGHFMTQRFYAFNAPLRVEPPIGRAARGG